MHGIPHRLTHVSIPPKHIPSLVIGASIPSTPSRWCRSSSPSLRRTVSPWSPPPPSPARSTIAAGRGVRGRSAAGVSFVRFQSFLRKQSAYICLFLLCVGLWDECETLSQGERQRYQLFCALMITMNAITLLLILNCVFLSMSDSFCAYAMQEIDTARHTRHANLLQFWPDLGISINDIDNEQYSIQLKRPFSQVQSFHFLMRLWMLACFLLSRNAFKCFVNC